MVCRGVRVWLQPLICDSNLHASSGQRSGFSLPSSCQRYSFSFSPPSSSCQRYKLQLSHPSWEHVIQEVTTTRGEIEIFREMWSMAEVQAGPNNDQTVDWKMITTNAAKALSPCSPYLASMAKCLQAHTGELLEDLGMFMKAFDRQDTSACLGGEFINALAELVFTTGPIKEHVPHVANALMEANYLSVRVVDNICRSVPVAAIKKLRSKGPQVKEAEQLLQKARQTGIKLQLSEDPHFVRALGYLNVRTVAHLLAMPRVWEQATWESLEDIAQDCCFSIDSLCVAYV